MKLTKFLQFEKQFHIFNNFIDFKSILVERTSFNLLQIIPTQRVQTKYNAIKLENSSH